MTIIHLIRHGTHDLVSQRLCGRTPGVGLSDTGRRQAQALARAFPRLDRVLTSPLDRTRETAAVIAAAHSGRLEEEAGTQPDNPKVWSLLFPLYQKIGQPGQAIGALERLIELEGRRVDLLAQLAQIKFFVAGRSLTTEVQALIDEILDKDPREPTVLGILGVEAFDDGRYEQAINYWRRALAGFGDNESAQAMRNGIAVARQRLEETANGAERVTD